MAAGTWRTAFGSVHLAMGTLSFCPARQGAASIEERTSQAARLLTGHGPALLVNRGVLRRTVLPGKGLDADPAIQVLFVALPCPHWIDLTHLENCTVHARGSGWWKAVEKCGDSGRCMPTRGNVDDW